MTLMGNGILGDSIGTVMRGVARNVPALIALIVEARTRFECGHLRGSPNSVGPKVVEIVGVVVWCVSSLWGWAEGLIGSGLANRSDVSGLQK